MADRIQARAIRRCGKILKEIEKAAGRPPKIRVGAVPNLIQKSTGCGSCSNEVEIDSDNFTCSVLGKQHHISRKQEVKRLHTIKG